MIKMLSHSCEKCSFNYRELCLYVSVTKIPRGKVSMDASNGLGVSMSRYHDALNTFNSQLLKIRTHGAVRARLKFRFNCH